MVRHPLIMMGGDSITPSINIDFITNPSIPAFLTFTRASNATYFDSAGLLQTVGNNIARFDYGIDAVYKGLLMEGNKTNFAIRCRDFTNAIWVKTTMNAALNQTGIDGTANSASSITATGANATILQTTVAGAALHIISCYVKRLVGTGTVEMTYDGVSYTVVPVTANWTRVSIPAVNSANPIIGFRLGTNGDSIAVDYFQCEDRNFITNPILTTAATASRVTESLAGDVSAFLNAAGGTLFINASPESDQSASTLNLNRVQVDDGTPNNRYCIRGTSNLYEGSVTVAGAGQAGFTPGGAWNGFAKIAMRVLANDFAYCVNGGTIFTDGAGTVPVVTTLRIGCESVVSSATDGYSWTKQVQYYPGYVTNAQLQALTA